MTLQELVKQLNLYLEAYPEKAGETVLINIKDEVKRFSEVAPLYQDTTTVVWNLLEHDDINDMEFEGTDVDDYEEFIVLS